MGRYTKIFILHFILCTVYCLIPLSGSANNFLKLTKLVVTPNDTICEGTTVHLRLQNPVGNLLWNTGATTDSVLVTPSSTSSYYVINDYGGSAQDTFFVTITVFPDLKPNINVRPSGIICKGDSVSLTVTNPVNNVLWSTNATTDSISFLGDTISDFFVINDAGGHCPDTSSIYVQIKSKNYTLIDIHGGGCPGIEVNINIVNPRGIIIWNTGNNSPYLNINPDTTTTYTLINNAFTKCADTLAVQIYVPLKITPKVSVYPNDSICEGDIVNLRILNPYKFFNWSNGSVDTVQHIVASLNNNFSVTNDYNGNCPVTTLANINVIDRNNFNIDVPNCFTPNGDGVNDVFKIADIIKSDYRIIIFNRWGEKMFESGEKGLRDWDGTFNNTNVNEGNYFWILNFKNYCGETETTKRGFVSVFR